jgi:hypothetical protein
VPKHKQTKKPLADWNLTGVELKKYKYMLTENTKQCNSDRASASTSHLSWSELRSYAKSLGLSAKGTRAEIELRLAAAADTDESFDFEDKKFNDLPSGSPTKTEPKQAPKTPGKPAPGKPAKVIPMTPGKKAATMSPVPQGVTLALANLARALKHSSNGIVIFSDTFKVLAIAQHFPEIYPGIWKAEFQGSTIGYLQKNVDGTYTGYKECPVREPDLSSPKGNFWVDAAANKPGSYKVTRVVTAKLSQKVSVHTVITDSRQGISCDCQSFVYRQHCCHVEAVDLVLRPQEKISQEIEALKVRAELIQEIRDRKLWILLNLIEPSVLNASLEELEEGNKELQNALALNNVLSA